MQFIYTGRTTAEYHVPGQSILGNDQKAPPVAEKTVTIDDLLISSAFVYELDETLAHYDLRGEISNKIGYALAEKYDRLIFRAIAKGARIGFSCFYDKLCRARWNTDPSWCWIRCRRRFTTQHT